MRRAPFDFVGEIIVGDCKDTNTGIAGLCFPDMLCDHSS